MITPGAYLRLRREAAGLSIEDVAALISTEPHLDALGRAEWLRLVEGDAAPIGASVIEALRAVFRFDPVVLTDLDDIARGAIGVPAPRVCRVCACSEECACVDLLTDLPCYWVASDLCSSCRPSSPPVAAAELPPGMAA